MSMVGEAFVAVKPDADDFAPELGAGIEDALSDVQGQVAESVDGIATEVTDGLAGVGDGAFDGIADEAAGAADDITAAFDGAGDGAFDGLADSAEAAANETSEAFAGVGDTIGGEISAGVEEAEGALGGLTDALGSVQGSMATLAGGAGMEGFARSQQDSNVALARMTDRLGESDDAIRDMVGGITDWTFSSHDAVAGMELLSQRGVDNLDTMEKLLPAWDDFADATGQDFVQAMDDGQRALGAFGIPAEDAAEHMDTLTFMANEVDVPMDRLARTVRGSEEDLEALGLGLDDTAGLLAAMGANGMDGRDAVALLGRGIKSADGDMDELLGTLGVTTDQFAEYTGKVQDAEGITSRQADQANSVATPMERLGGFVENLGFRFGGLAETAGMVAAPLGALGPIMFGASQASGALAKAGPMLGGALRGVTGAFRALGAAILANPLFLIAALVVGIIAVIWHFREEIMAALGAAWDWIRDTFGDLWEWFTGLWDSLVDTVTGVLGSLVEWFKDLPGRILGALQGLATTVYDFVMKWHPLAILWRAITGGGEGSGSGVLGWLRDLPGRIVDAIAGFATTVVDFIRKWHPLAVLWRMFTGGERSDGDGDGVVGWLRELPGKLIDALKELPGRVLDFIMEWHPLAILWRGFERLFPDVAAQFTEGIGEVIEWFRDLASNVVGIVSGWVENVVGFVTDLWQRWVELVHTIRDAVIDAVVALVAKVVSTVAKWVIDIVGFVTDLWDQWTSLVQSIRDTVIEFVTGMATRVVTTVSGWVSDLIGHVTGLRDRFLERVGELIDGAVQWFRDLPGRIMEALGDLGSLLFDIGKDLIGGLTDGIKDVAMAPVKAVRDVGSNIVSGTKRFFGMSSPSKVFAEIGEDLDRGLAQGVEGSDDSRRAVEAVSAQLAGVNFDLAAPTMAAPAAAQPQGAAAQAATTATAGGPLIGGDLIIYSTDPKRSGDEVLRSLRERAYLAAPLTGRR